MSPKAACSTLAVVASILTSSVASADDRAEAEELFERGRDAMAARDFPRACALFEASLRKDDATGTLLNLALCDEARGKLATAWGELRAVEQRSRAASRTDRADFAHERAEALRPRLPRLQLRLDDRDVVVTIDGSPTAVALLDAGVPIDLGEHEIVATMPKKIAWTTHVRVEREGHAVAVHVPALTPEIEPPPQEVRPVARPTRTAGFVVGGIGIGSLAIGGVFSALAMSQRSASRCESPCYDASSAQRAYEHARTDANAANVAIGVGVVALAVGVVLVLTSKDARF